MVTKPEPNANDAEQGKGIVVIKKYANRRLYNTETSSYVTLEDIAKMVRSDREFQVFDAKTGDDLTHSVLTQIIVEQESRQGGQALLPVPFLRQLIRFYDDSLARMVPSYLQMSLETLLKEQDRFRAQMLGATWAGTAYDTYREQARRNLVVFEQAMKMWTPFAPVAIRPADFVAPTDPAVAALATPVNPAPALSPPIQVAEVKANGEANGPAHAATALPPAGEASDELSAMRAQLAAMQAQIDKMARQRR